MYKIKRKKYLLAIIQLVITTSIIAFLFSGCVDTVTEPYPGVPGITPRKPVITVDYPVAGDSIYMGRNEVIYAAADYAGGPGISSYDLFVNGELIQTFPQNENGTNPIIYIDTDTVAAVLDIDPFQWPNEISYFITVYNRYGQYGTTGVIDSIYVDKRPAAPSNLVLTRNTDQIFNLLWEDNSSNEEYFELWRKDGENAGYLKIMNLPANIVSINDYVPSSIINYAYKIRAVNTYGYSKFSNEVFSSGGNAPSDLKAEALGATVIKLSWTDNSVDELVFQIERKNLQSGIFQLLTVVPANSYEYFDEGLHPSTAYTYRVGYVTITPPIEWSNEATAITFEKDIPGPSNLVADFDYATRYVKLRWQDNTEDEIGTFIERREGLLEEFEEIGTTPEDMNEYMDSTVVPNTIYYYRVRQMTIEGFRTPYSNEDSAFVPKLPPIAPSNMRIDEFDPGKVYGLSWDDNSNDEDGFELWRKDGENALYQLYKYLDVNTKAVNDTIGNPTITYYYKVRSVRDNEKSEFSNEVNTSSGTSGLAAPSNLSGFANVTAVDTIEVSLTWRDNSSEELGFIIERKRFDETDYYELKRVGPNTTGWVDGTPGLFTNTTFNYRVKAYSAQNESSYSNVASVYIPLYIP